MKTNIEELLAVVEKATSGPWNFRKIDDRGKWLGFSIESPDNCKTKDAIILMPNVIG